MFKKLIHFLFPKAPGYSITPKKKKYDKDINKEAKNFVLKELFERDVLYSVMKVKFLLAFNDRGRQFFYNIIIFLKDKDLIECKTFGFAGEEWGKDFLHFSLTEESDKAIDEILNEDDSVITDDLYTQIKTKVKQIQRR